MFAFEVNLSALKRECLQYTVGTLAFERKPYSVLANLIQKNILKLTATLTVNEIRTCTVHLGDTNPIHIQHRLDSVKRIGKPIFKR